MTTLVVTAAQVLTRMGIESHADAEAAINSVLPAAHLVFESILNSEFELVTDQQDTFYADSDRYPLQRDGFFRLLLTHGFVHADAVVVEYSSSLAPDSEEWTEIDAAEYQVSAEKGLVLVPHLYKDLYIRVTYDAGVDPVGTVSPQHEAPDWLVEAVLQYVPSILNSSQVTNRSDEAKPQYDQNLRVAGALLEKRMRAAPFMLRALL